MSAYIMNEATFELPAGFVDKTVHLLEAGGGTLGLMVCRTPFPPGTPSLRAAVEAHVSREARAMVGHRVLAFVETERAGRPRVEVSARYRSGGELAYQRQAHGVERGLWLLVAATGRLVDRATVDAHLDHVLASYLVRS